MPKKITINTTLFLYTTPTLAFDNKSLYGKHHQITLNNSFLILWHSEKKSTYIRKEEA